MICKMKKGIYGLNQSQRVVRRVQFYFHELWFLSFFLRSLDLYLHFGIGYVICIAYVDDILNSNSDVVKIQKVKDILRF